MYMYVYVCICIYTFRIRTVLALSGEPRVALGRAPLLRRLPLQAHHRRQEVSLNPRPISLNPKP